MVETISPVVHGGRTKRYLLSLSMHALGATGSSALLGASLGWIGALSGAPWDPATQWVIVAGACIWGLGALGIPVPIPQAGRQVPEWWRTFYSPPVAAFLYGLGLGVGFPFRLGSGTLTVVAIGCLAIGDPLVGMLGFGAFGFSRALAVAAAGRPDDEAVDRLTAMSGSALIGGANAMVLAAVALAALTQG